MIWTWLFFGLNVLAAYYLARWQRDLNRRADILDIEYKKISLMYQQIQREISNGIDGIEIEIWDSPKPTVSGAGKMSRNPVERFPDFPT